MKFRSLSVLIIRDMDSRMWNQFQYADTNTYFKVGYQSVRFTFYRGIFHFNTHMDLEGLDATLIKYPINTLFSNTIITINPHFMPINLEPFRIFAPIPMN